MVQKSLMPKGVDHTPEEFEKEFSDVVQKSLMPKGVDHFACSTSQISVPAAVQKSLMPKGVDH